MDKKQSKKVGFSAIYLIVALLLAGLFQQLIFQPMVIRWTEVPYSRFLEQLAAGEIAEVTLTADRIMYTCCGDAAAAAQGRVHNVVRVDDPDLIQRLVDAGVTFSGEAPTNALLPALLGWIIPMLPLGLIWYFGLRRMGQAGADVMSIGKSKAQEITGEKTGIKFENVGGVDEVEVELKEIIDFLKDPQRFTRLGAKLPKGVLLVGPPGTGKTLLAKATAGEAGVPFFSISGSDFVEMFVGVGAARVRDLFEQAKHRAPCIVFIDEIDAIGQSRSTVGALGSNDEREQTLNQLLAEMDGFQPNLGVIIMAATNRPEILDRALLRPGRFDRQIQVGLPTEVGRRQILDIHTKGVQLGPDVDLGRIAQITAGFSGADLANIVNEAALLAVRSEREAVTMGDFDLAIERVVAGLQRKITLKPELKRRVAYHEGGHALVAQLQPDTDPVHKVSIIPTAKGALGYTMQMPEEDTYLMSRRELEERLAVILGGRAAELLIFNDTSTGAANDLEVVTALARRMVTEFGMTEALGPVRYAMDAGTSYLGRFDGLRQDISPETATLIDKETRRIIEDAERRAVELLQQHSDALHEIARILQEKEVISGDEIKRLAQKPV
ncbi:MAG TPA: ATP-dependent zinc metalloprotease FtsH [Anaerolineae bacterium]|nr:ATP-dependent zinc metalloprotease FtsH [Anaerolineae bacterium]HQI86026.1 ATP-dependent zinc metalloprotease FtsH [Anaerolineae bacterium]